MLRANWQLPEEGQAGSREEKVSCNQVCFSLQSGAIRQNKKELHISNMLEERIVKTLI